MNGFIAEQVLKKRRLVSGNESAVDLGFKAAEKLFQNQV